MARTRKLERQKLEARAKIKKERFILKNLSFFEIYIFASDLHRVTQGAPIGTSALELLLRIPFGYCIVPFFSFAFIKTPLASLRALSLPSTSS